MACVDVFRGIALAIGEGLFVHGADSVFCRHGTTIGICPVIAVLCCSWMLGITDCVDTISAAVVIIVFAIIAGFGGILLTVLVCVGEVF